MNHEEKAEEITGKCMEGPYHVKLDCQVCSAQEEIVKALKEAYEAGLDVGIQNKCKLISECKRQWIERCAEIAETCDLYEPDNCGVAIGDQVAQAIRREKNENK